MNLTQLRVFDTVMRAGTVTEAARRLFVTQPAVTNHLKALEDHYDIALFRRQGRHLRPTRLGHELAEISGRLFALEEEAGNLLEATRKLEHGSIRIASDGPHLLIPIIKAFRERFPGVRVAIEIANTEEVQALLIAERCDVSIQAHREDDSRVHSMQLADFELVVFVDETHPWTIEQRTSISIHELQGPGMVVREEGTTARRVLDSALELAGVSANYIIETTSRETVKEAVAAGLGIGVVADYELHGDARFWQLRIEDADLRFTEEVQCLNRRRNMRVVREFLQVTEQVIASGVIPTAT